MHKAFILQQAPMKLMAGNSSSWSPNVTPESVSNANFVIGDGLKTYTKNNVTSDSFPSSNKLYVGYTYNDGALNPSNGYLCLRGVSNGAVSITIDQLFLGNGSINQEATRSAVTLDGCITVEGNGTILVSTYSPLSDDNRSLTFTGELKGTGNLLLKTENHDKANHFASLTIASSANEFTGGVTTDAGSVITLSGTNALHNASSFTNNGSLTLSANQTLNNLSGSGTIANGGQALTLNNTASTNTEFSGVISGTGALTKTGAGTLTLSNANTYTGATTVTAGELIFSGSTLPVSAMTATGGTLVLGSAGNAIAAQGGSSITADGGDVRVDGNLNINSGVVTVQGDWTGNGAINVNNGGEMHVATSFSHTNEIMLNGGTLRNPTDGQNAVIESTVNVISDSYMQAADKKYTALNGVLKGSGNITIQSGTGSVNFSGDASQYTGSFNVYGIMRIGALDTDVSDSAALIGSKPITLYGGEIQNNNSDVTVTNDLILMEESYFQARHGKNLTLTGSITGDGTFHVHSSNAKNQNGWVIAATTCTDNSFTGDVWMDNDSNPYGWLKLGADNAFGTNAGTAIVWGTLDLDGHKQTFAGLYNNGNTSKGTVDSTQPGGVLTLKLNEGNSQSFGNVVKGQLSLVITGDGTGTQTLVEAPLYTGSTTIEAGTLKLTAGGTLYNLSGGSLDENGQIAVPGKLIATGNLTLNNEQMTKFIGSISATTIEKTGDGTLQLYSDADNMISAQSLVVSSGRLDMKEYFKGQLEVKNGATLSPGNSVGTLEIDKLIIGETTYGGGFILNEEGATLLMEIGGQTPEENDMLIVNGPLSIDKGIIYLALADENNFTSGMDFEAQIQAGTESDNYVDAITNALVPGWPFYNLSVTQAGNVYSIHGTYDTNAVPEPSTWALLLLGAAGLLYVRKQTRK